MSDTSHKRHFISLLIETKKKSERNLCMRHSIEQSGRMIKIKRKSNVLFFNLLVKKKSVRSSYIDEIHQSLLAFFELENPSIFQGHLLEISWEKWLSAFFHYSVVIRFVSNLIRIRIALVMFSHLMKIRWPISFHFLRIQYLRMKSLVWLITWVIEKKHKK